MATFNGFQVMEGVKWAVTPESVTITCYPKKSEVPYVLTTKSWKNYCPTCKKEGKMTGFGKGVLSNGRGKWGIEGGVTCLICDADFCGVTGRDTYIGSSRKMIPAASITTNPPSSSSVVVAKCELTKAEALAKATKVFEDKSKSKYKGSIVVPMLPLLKPDQFCAIDIPGFSAGRQSMYWIESVKVDIDNQTMTAALLESMPVPKNEPKGDNKVTSTNQDLGIKADSDIERTVMLKGKELGNIDAIFNWLRVGGNGGWSYKFYYDHWQNKGSAFTKDIVAMKTCWEKKQANCTDFAWIFYTMCLGAGITVRIIHGTARFGSSTYGHLWNTYNGKIYDCSSRSATNYNMQRTVL